MLNWKETALGEIGKVITGKTPSKNNPNDWGEIYNFITPTDIKNDDKFINQTKRSISEEGKVRFKNLMIDEYSVIVTCIGSDMGKVVISKNKSLTNQQINSITVYNDHNVDFIYYKLKNSYKLLKRLAGSGSTMPILNKSDFSNIKLKFPPLPEQKAIAKVLTAFDDKIELLQQQNKTLETIAQTIFKEWFGKYQIGDELPEGWKSFELSQLVETVNGYSYKGKELVEESDEAMVSLKSFDRNGGFQTRGFKPFIGNPKPSQEVKIGDLVVAHTDLTQDAEVLGNPAFIFDDGGFKKMFITMDLVKVNSINDDISSSFLYYLMKDRAFKGHCVGYSNGTTVLHLSKKAIPEYQIFLPSDFSIIKKFTDIANATTNKISLNKEEIKSLKKTRDTLLPKLMSGQVRVKNLKEA